MESLDKLKKWYKIKWSDNVSSLKEAFAPILRIGIRDKIKDFIIEWDENKIIVMVKNIIPDFEVEEFLEKAREENNIFVDYWDRIKKWLWYKQDYMYDWFIYFWERYKRKEDFTIEEVEKLYKNIWVRKIKEDKLKKFNEFILINSKQIISRKSKIRGLIKELINFWDITNPKNILKNIENEELKNDFINCLKILKINILI
jgi:hypothetical protein